MHLYLALYDGGMGVYRQPHNTIHKVGEAKPSGCTSLHQHGGAAYLQGTMVKT